MSLFLVDGSVRNHFADREQISQHRESPFRRNKYSTNHFVAIIATLLIIAAQRSLSVSRYIVRVRSRDEKVTCCKRFFSAVCKDPQASPVNEKQFFDERIFFFCIVNHDVTEEENTSLRSRQDFSSIHAIFIEDLPYETGRNGTGRGTCVVLDRFPSIERERRPRGEGACSFS